MGRGHPAGSVCWGDRDQGVIPQLGLGMGSEAPASTSRHHTRPATLLGAGDGNPCPCCPERVPQQEPQQWKEPSPPLLY